MANLVPTLRVTNRGKVDNRHHHGHPFATYGFLFEIPDTVNTLTILNQRLNGVLPKYSIASPAIPTDTVFTLTILDQNGRIVYQKTDHTDNTTEDIDLTTPFPIFAGRYDIRINFATALSGDTAEFDLELFITNFEN